MSTPTQTPAPSLGKYEAILWELIQKNDKLVVMTAENRAVLRNLPKIAGDRFIDVGITEQTMIGMAAGLASRGRTVICHALATFLTLRPFEFIRDDIGIPKLPVKLVGWIPGFLSDANGPTHQAIEDISLMRGIPGMNIFAPSNEEELLTGIRAVIESPDPFYIRYCPRPAKIEHSKYFEIGKAEVLFKGKDVTFLTYGFMLESALEARKLLTDKGLSVGIVNLRTVKPIDEAAILEAAQSSDAVVTLEDHFLTGGLYSICAELFIKNRMAPKVIPIALDNRWFKPALLNDVLAYEGFDGVGVTRKVLTALGKA
jgi:transketolase